ncbi:MAG TPA: phosphate acetyltransferase [Spirochaetota bacterium]|nr:phosphate acetyltransferase [Spirochaetota bacterium]
MAKNLFITTTDGEGGKTIVSLGIMELLLRKLGRVAYFRPIIQVTKNKSIEDHFALMKKYFKLDLKNEQMYAYNLEDAQVLVEQGKWDVLITDIISKYKQLEEEYDFVLCEGTDFEEDTSAIELDINVRVASLIMSPVLLVTRANNRDMNKVIQSMKIATEQFQAGGCQVLGSILNRVPEDRCVSALEMLSEQVDVKDKFTAVLPESKRISAPSIAEVAKAIDATVLFGEEQLSRPVNRFSVGGLHLENYLWGLSDGMMIITSGDRVDILLGAILANQSKNFPEIAGIILTGEYYLHNMIIQLVGGIPKPIPILVCRDDIFSVATRLENMKSAILPDDSSKIATALSLFETHVDLESLSKKIIESKTDKITPKMFEYNLIQQAKKDKRHIVLPEGNDDRILKAADVLLSREVVNLTILGDVDKVKARAYELGLKLDKANFVDPENSPLTDKYAKAFYELRKSKGVTLEDAINTVKDVSYFGTMMVHMNDADGMVSGAAHSTAHTIRPSLQTIKTKPGTPIVSSVFLMCLKDRVKVFGDCAVNPDPNSEELAHIAISSAETAEMFGVQPKIAMMSYSTGTSGTGPAVDKVREATDIAKKLRPDLLLDGPIQYDAAVSKSVGGSKMPGSQVAGQATVYIFPDLNTGNNTYKAVQREAGTLAIGPILQGLNKPVNDLSRGCLIPDIINTVAITAVQAQYEAKRIAEKKEND